MEEHSIKREFIGIMGKLSCELEETEGAVIVHAAGKADIYTSNELTKILQAYLARGKKNLLLDCGKLEYLDSSTLAGLLKIQKEFQAAGGAIKLLRLNGEPLKVFEATGFLSLFENFSDREGALKSFL